MKYKKTIILLVLVVFLLSIAGVSASEIDNTIASENANTIELSTDNDIEDNLQTSEENEALASPDYDEAIAQTDTEVLGEDFAKYSDLAAEISQPGNINLTHKNYTYDKGETITISEANKVIDGNGAVIDMNGSTIRAFRVSASGVTIKNLTIKNANFNGDGGAVWIYSGTVSNCNFTNNTATGDGGAVYFDETGTVTNCNFTGNNAAYGSAIFFNSYGYAYTISNSIFLNNLANAESLEIIKNDNNITITFKGKDNLLNAIYSLDDVNFANVTYWGANGIVNTDSSTPSRSKNEAGQNITVGIVVNDKLVLDNVYVTDENGMIVLDISAGDNYYISVRHGADSYYTEAERTITNNTKFNVNVTSQTTTNKTVNITAKSNIPNDVVKGKLLFILPNSIQINATYAGDGIWWAEHTFDDYGVYQVNATYVGLDNVTVNNGTISISEKKIETSISAADVSTTYNINRDLVIALKDSNGNALSGVSLTVDLNGAKTYTTDGNGQVKISTKGLAIKTYAVKITFAGNAKYAPSSKEVKVTVKKAKPKIIAKKKTYRAKKKTKKFTITLKDNKGKPIKKVKVRLIVQKIKKTSKNKNKKSKKNKKKNIVKTNKKGKATFKINRYKKGKYLATVKFYGNKYYSKTVKKVKINLK